MLDIFRATSAALFFGAMTALAGCGGGNSTPPPVANVPPPSVPPPPTSDSGAFRSDESTTRFLTMATFGPDPNDVAALTGTSPSEWIRAEFNKPESPFLSDVQSYYDIGTRPAGEVLDGFDYGATTWVFWRNAVEGDDQLRQRLVFALSQITVVSSGSSGLLGIFPQTVGYFQDILSEHAFGNYRDLLKDVTYSPAMAEFLTYLGNQRADPATGRVPDENYAREILQLFTVGLIGLNSDGTPQLDTNGNPIEIYDNNDITELAKVFTGLYNPELNLRQGLFARLDRISQAARRPLIMNNQAHSPESKTFLDVTIPANTPGDQSIDLALDGIMAHPNVGPFVGRQLIQRLVTSNPSPNYVRRVATAFDQGSFVLPDGSTVGAGRKGDMQATIAAILFDPEIDPENGTIDDNFGKVREPILRLTHFLRAFDADITSPEYAFVLYDTSPINALAQHPFRSPSVFNFYRPGYVAPGTLSGALGLTAPELQIVNASSTPGYINLLTYGTLKIQEDRFASVRPLFTASSVPFDDVRARQTFVPDYSDALPLAGNPEGLIDYLDGLLLYGSMTAQTRQELIATLEAYPSVALQTTEQQEDFIGFAVLLVMSSPDYLVQR